MKYIKHKTDGFIIFLPPITHIEMVEKLGYEKKDISSAGFININENYMNCYGRSESLDIESATEDSEELNCLAEAMNTLVMG